MAESKNGSDNPRKQPEDDDETQGPVKPDRNEIRGIQRRLRRTSSVTGLTEEEIRLLSIYQAAVEPDPMELLAIKDPAERIAHVERQKRRAQYTDLFYDDELDTKYVGINSERYLRTERSLKELLVVKGATEKIIEALEQGYREQQEYHCELLKQLAERLNEEGGDARVDDNGKNAGDADSNRADD